MLPSMRRRRLIASWLLLCLTVPLVTTLTADMLVRRATSLWSTDNASEALELLQRSADLSIWRSSRWELLARAALSSGAAARAETAMQAVRSPSLEGYLTLALAQLQQHRLDDAEATLREAADAYGWSAPIRWQLALLYRQAGHYDLERAALRELVQTDPSDAAAFYRMGLLGLVMDPEPSTGELETASALDVSYSDAVRTIRVTIDEASVLRAGSARWITLGRGLGLVGEWELARHAFSAATQMDRRNGEAWAWLGESLQHLGEDGRAALDEAAARSGRSAVVHGLRGLYWQRLGQFATALEEFVAAAELEPENPIWHQSIGALQVVAGDLSAALSSYQEAAQIAPHDAAVWRQLAAFCAKNHMNVEDVGLPAAVRSAALGPTDPASVATLGWLYAVTGRYTLAERRLRQALQLDDSDQLTRLRLAEVLLAQGREAESQTLLLSVISMQPDPTVVERAAQLLSTMVP